MGEEGEVGSYREERKGFMYSSQRALSAPMQEQDYFDVNVNFPLGHGLRLILNPFLLERARGRAVHDALICFHRG